MPNISVIVPVYNTEKFLHCCIDSILAQTFTDFELLLIDDGSKDNSSSICDEYAHKDNRVRVFHKENGGVSSARNLGLDKARGKWISFVDSDDWVENDWLISCVKILESNDYLDVIRWGYVKDYKSFSLKYVLDESCLVKSPIDMLNISESSCYYGFLVTCLIRKSIIDKLKLRFDDSLCYSEDHNFTYSLFPYLKTMYFMNKVFYHYIIHTNSLSNTKDFYMIKKSAEIGLFKQLKIVGNDNNYVQQVYSRYIDSILYSLNLLYQQNILYADRKRFINSIKVVNSERKIAILIFSKYPFFIKDLLLKIFFKL